MNLTCETLSRRSLELPHHVIFETDNTTREQRNQFTMMWQAAMVARGVFRTITQRYFIVEVSENRGP